MFMWTDEEKRMAVPGCTVCIESSPNYEAGRYEVIEGSTERFVMLKVDGFRSSVPWDRCDPATLNTDGAGDIFAGFK